MIPQSTIHILHLHLGGTYAYGTIISAPDVGRQYPPITYTATRCTYIRVVTLCSTLTSDTAGRRRARYVKRHVSGCSRHGRAGSISEKRIYRCPACPPGCPQTWMGKTGRQSKCGPRPL